MTTTHPPLGFAGEGAVHQDGRLPIRECRYCGLLIVWATSKRTAKRYPVNVRRGHLNQCFYMKHDVHRCERS